ncbi:MAG: RdgB/HAM1 family non-canonical purine NTP pyrophosphatase [Candidatus Hydrogenedentes bacterium]|nr:RdgB/HAM1 family non-canonical purine NTP pyrophosphatase [Candidatus Hydrogenedentota bacterium]
MSLPPLLIATTSAHKFTEIAAFLDGIPWQLKSLRDFPRIDAPEENGDSFEANAIIKARSYGDRFGVACVADDSGLVVDALNGAPGIYSARYAGEVATDHENNEKLLAALESVPSEKRTARFVCCCALLIPRTDSDVDAHVETGTVDGHIAFETSGAHGFGYDPLFIPNGHDKSFGELGPEIKSTISHRAQAFRKLRAFLARTHLPDFRAEGA